MSWRISSIVNSIILCRRVRCSIWAQWHPGAPTSARSSSSLMPDPTISINPSFHTRATVVIDKPHKRHWIICHCRRICSADRTPLQATLIACRSHWGTLSRWPSNTTTKSNWNDLTHLSIVTRPKQPRGLTMSWSKLIGIGPRPSEF